MYVGWILYHTVSSIELNPNTTIVLQYTGNYEMINIENYICILLYSLSIVSCIHSMLCPTVYIKLCMTLYVYLNTVPKLPSRCVI